MASLSAPEMSSSISSRGSCGPHVDSFQFVGSSVPGPVITGNFFHDESTGIVGYDNANSATITNNVLMQSTKMRWNWEDLT